MVNTSSISKVKIIRNPGLESTIAPGHKRLDQGSILRQHRGHGRSRTFSTKQQQIVIHICIDTFNAFVKNDEMRLSFQLEQSLVAVYGQEAAILQIIILYL